MILEDPSRMSDAVGDIMFTANLVRFLGKHPDVTSCFVSCFFLVGCLVVTELQGIDGSDEPSTVRGTSFLTNK